MRKINRIAMIISMVLIVALGVITFVTRQQERAESAHLLALREEARVYEKQITEINAELEEERQRSESLCDVATVVVGYAVSTPEELARYTDGAIVLDCHADYSLLWSAVETGREIILTCEPFEADYVSYAKGVTGASAFLLQEEEAAEQEDETVQEVTLGYYSQTVETGSYSDAQIIGQLGFTTCIRIGSGIQAAEVSENMLNIPCVEVLSSEAQLADSLAPMLSARDFAVVILHTEIGQTGIRAQEDALQSLEKEGTLQLGTISDVEYVVQNAQKISKERKEAFNRYAVQQQERIEELNDKIQAIYAEG